MPRKYPSRSPSLMSTLQRSALVNAAWYRLLMEAADSLSRHVRVVRREKALLVISGVMVAQCFSMMV